VPSGHLAGHIVKVITMCPLITLRSKWWAHCESNLDEWLRSHVGHIMSHILKETHGFFHKVTPGHLAEHMLKELNMYLPVTCWLNCLKNHNVITMETLGKWGSAPSVFNTNRIAAVLGHLQGVVGDLQTVQMQERGRRIASGESGSLEIVAMDVVERALDEEFSDLSLSRVIGELEDFDNNVDQEGPEQ